MRRPLVVGNWKMNGTRASVAELLGGLKAGIDRVTTAEVAVCAPSVYIPLVQSELEGSAVAWGGQDVSAYTSGPHTGETAASMLVDFGCRFVIVGHSERRSHLGASESDKMIAAKFYKACDAGLIPILCVGESMDECKRGLTEEKVGRQLDAVVSHCGIDKVSEGVIAYEPIWAIGTGKTATPEQAQEVHAFIRARLAQASQSVADTMQILYGGSMNPDNAADLIAQKDIDGGLIGCVSLKADEFLAICAAANS